MRGLRVVLWMVPYALVCAVLLAYAARGAALFLDAALPGGPGWIARVVIVPGLLLAGWHGDRACKALDKFWEAKHGDV